ncbi:MAG: CTQ-dependent lysine 6-oxidase LodA [Planctomycetota bacterium]
MDLEIHPRIGVARLGNSVNVQNPALTEFYLSPETVGGLPIKCDQDGNASDPPDFVTQFKDSVGRVIRQAAKFRIFDGDKEVQLGDGQVKSIKWMVHIANKKPIWYTFSELLGDLEFGPDNSYEAQHVPVNNPDVTDESERKALIIDPGPRSVDEPGTIVDISRYNIPGNYRYGSFPPASAGGTQIDTLGNIRMDRQGNLIVLGGLGNVTGDADITSFRGAAGYWDDIADGYVLATVTLEDGTTIDTAPAWLIVGSPKYAPELVNITTLYDTMYDVGIRKMNLDPSIYSADTDTSDAFPSHDGYTPLNHFQPDYEVDFETQILPIIERMQSYRWVADAPYLNDFASPGFDLSDSSPENKDNRMRYFSFFRVPVLPEDYADWIHKVKRGPNQLFSGEDGLQGVPLMPLNSGDNSVTNEGPIYKFETLSATQYFFMNQWAEGKFTSKDGACSRSLRDQLDESGVGNCVGVPFSPGIETTWITRNAPIYSQPFQFKIAHYSDSNDQLEAYYADNGLSTTADEADGQGCEPGDLTKRMAIPWQADFQECTVQTPNISDPNINQFADGTGIEVPPTYYVYWWPPQSPMHVMTGALNPEDQVLDAVVSQIAGQPVIPAGQRVSYQRGINNVQDMIDSWSRLGFIVNQGLPDYPYFVETERNFGALGQLAVQQVATKLQASLPK